MYSFFHTTRLAVVVGLCLSGVCGKVEVSSKTLDTACLALDKSGCRRVISSHRKAVQQIAKGHNGTKRQRSKGSKGDLQRLPRRSN